MLDKCIVLVEFVFCVDQYEVEGNATLFFGKNDVIPMTDEDILKEIKAQYGYNAIRILHRQREKA
ncbi:hypothetical protein AAGS61_01860 [Lysinibacillus sp. KU-BSD001]|uniref:hypothetical protein n=1 Tax=Lysinibacillus sp. KU-BSD001 TaxID=3141328 RepID=UPI0036E0DC3F